MTSKLPTVLLTGFEPFAGDAINPSWDAVRALHSKCIAGHRIVSARLPVTFDGSLDALRIAIAKTHPVLVICVGLAGSRAAISLERIAINIDDARIPDNTGLQPVDEPIVAGAPAAYFSTLPIKAMLRALHDAGIPAEVSQTAGTYVCNHVFYSLMHALAANSKIRGGFIHVPPLAEHADASGLALETLIAALRIAIETAIATDADVRLAAGAEG
jgi:pyroglutamyl-peptidase